MVHEQNQVVTGTFPKVVAASATHHASHELHLTKIKDGTVTAACSCGGWALWGAKQASAKLSHDMHRKLRGARG